MVVNGKAPSALRAGFALLVAAVALGGCTANRMVVPRPALPGPERLDVPAARLLLASFHTNADGTDRYLEPIVRAAFLDLLRQRTGFVQVVDGTFQPIVEDMPTIRLDVNVFADHTRNRTIILDVPFFYPFLGYWPISPLWGEATVNVSATMTGRGGAPVTLSAVGRSSYSIIFYSWYRTEPIETAYAEAYGEAFEALAAGAARQQAAVQAMLGAPLPLAPAPVPVALPAPAAQPVPMATLAPELRPSLLQPARPGSSRRLAVLEFRGEASTSVLALLADEARSGALAATRGQSVVVMTRESMAVLLRDMGRGGECREGECEVETARNIGADYVVTGELQRIEDVLFISLKLHEVQTGALVNTARVSGKSTVEVVEKVREASAGLFR